MQRRQQAAEHQWAHHQAGGHLADHRRLSKVLEQRACALATSSSTSSCSRNRPSGDARCCTQVASAVAVARATASGAAGRHNGPAARRPAAGPRPRPGSAIPTSSVAPGPAVYVHEHSPMCRGRSYKKGTEGLSRWWHKRPAPPALSGLTPVPARARQRSHAPTDLQQRRSWHPTRSPLATSRRWTCHPARSRRARLGKNCSNRWR